LSPYRRVFLSLGLAAALLLGVAWDGAAQYPWWGPYPYPRHYGFDPGAAVRLDVKPKEAEVYVDGYYAGIVDDFNGVFQRLRLPPGEHEITLYRDAYRTVHQKVYLTPDHTFKVKLAMEPLGAGEPPEPRPQPTSPLRTGGQNQPGAPPMYPPARGPAGRRAPHAGPPQPLPAGAPSAQESGYGTLAIRVQPNDAEVLVDGEKWRRGPDPLQPQGLQGSQGLLSVEMPAGRHSIQIQKPGYRTYVTEVEVRSGETASLNVSMRSQNDE
jgi:hypothetical protein